VVFRVFRGYGTGNRNRTVHEESGERARAADNDICEQGATAIAGALIIGSTKLTDLDLSGV
jgi:hypothetical protein